MSERVIRAPRLDGRTDGRMGAWVRGWCTLKGLVNINSFCGTSDLQLHLWYRAP